MRLIDCQGLAGAYTLGAVQAGFTLTHRASLGKFGDKTIDENRHLVGDAWTQDDGDGWDQWEPAEGGFLAGTPPCFAAGTAILTGNGLVPIERVRAGDLVYTHAHRWQRVLRTGSKTASTVRVGVTECTPEHRWYTSVIPPSPTAEIGEIAWTRARDLQGMRLATPSYVSPPPATAPALGDEIWWIIGRWLGDGWLRVRNDDPARTREIHICCGAHEADELEARIGPGWSRQTTRTGAKFVRSDKEFASFLMGHFGHGAARKRLPAWLFSLPVTSRQALLEGYKSADGYQTRPGTKVRLGSMSRCLLVGMRLLAVGLGHTTSTLVPGNRAGTGVIEGRTVSIRDSYEVGIADNDGRYTRDADGFHWTKCRKAVNDAGLQVVYDLEVETDHSFIADGYVVHNCSGFSVLSLGPGWERGPGSPINSCMHELVQYAGRCTGLDGGRGVEVVSLESVQGAFKKGRGLMRELRDKLVAGTGQQYDIHHVLMSGSTVGAPQFRHRYYLILSRVPFGIDEPQREDLPDGRPVTYYDTLADLQGLESRWEDQARLYAPASNFAQGLVREDGLVDCHVPSDGNKIAKVVHEACGRGWQTGSWLSEAFDQLDYHPEEFQRSRKPEGIRRGDSSYRGLSWPRRVNPARPAHVITGGGARDFVHWTEPRLLTIRELSRLMGYPDAWRWPHSVSQASAQIGKCCPVSSGRWISRWVKRALEEEPGQTGAEIDDGEFLYNWTNLYKGWFPAS